MSDRFFNGAGWWLFVVCAGLFIVASARAGDILALAGSAAFMAANISFLIPFYRRSENEDREE
ncbi:MAG: hypothetical protein GTN90_01265 [Xanthomonadales bacterium]|nr:hypothetical protein [Xanthomonadales bacterium]